MYVVSYDCVCSNCYVIYKTNCDKAECGTLYQIVHHICIILDLIKRK